MMPDAAPFLAAIRAAPDDDAPRLVYADWLDEHGQPERAEFIRVQCELARRESPELRKREAELLGKHHDLLLGQLAGPHLRFRFRRGLIVGFGHTGIYRAKDPQSSFLTSTELRFFPNGRVQFATVNECEPALAGFWYLASQRAEAEYAVWSFEDYSEVTFDFLHNELPCSFNGWLWRTGLSLERREYGFDRRTYLQDFAHIQIPDLDSFQES